MNFRWQSRSILLTLVAILALGLLFAGCSKKAPVQTDPNAGQVVPEPVEEIPAETVAEPQQPEVPAIDYASLQPADFGVEDVYFALDQYDLDGEAMSILARDARVLREADVPIMIAGHCDERGTVEYNMALGEKRAQVVRDYLVSLGVPSRNLRTTSFGKSKPFAFGHNEDAWALNRRAHFARP